MNNGKPFSPASERNRGPILKILRTLFSDVKSVLEIGSGTGQHAVYFASEMPHLVWQTSDLAEHHPGIRLWVDDAALPNVLPPLLLDVNNANWPIDEVDAVFTANTLHIASWQSVENMFAGVSRVLSRNGLFCVYGPFSYDGLHTSESNAQFDRSLRARDPHSGIRDFADVIALASRKRLSLKEDQSMPANNRFLIFRKTASVSGDQEK